MTESVALRPAKVVSIKDLSQDQYRALPRTPIELKRREDATGMLWLADGTRIAFNSTGNRVWRVEGVVDAEGKPIYEVDFNTVSRMKPATH